MKRHPSPASLWRSAALLLLALVFTPAAVSGQDRIYFSAVDDVRAVLVRHINAETVRIDVSAWYLTDREVSLALLNRFRAGVPVRLTGDRGAIFEIDERTKHEFYWLASQGVPIRLRYNPSWFPEIVHWKATIFVGQGVVSFGSANYTPFELAPYSSADYKDETVLFTDDPSLVAAFRSRFDRMWNDEARETGSRIAGPPYFRDWDDACSLEPACSDYRTLYPNPVPMFIDTRRLEDDAPTPPDLIWSQGPAFNRRLVEEIDGEPHRVDIVVYRLTTDGITDALLRKHRSGVPVRVIVEPFEYLNRLWPEFWLTHANVDRLWAAGVQVKRRRHQGLTHMKMLVTSDYATVASSNFSDGWQRDHNYFVPAAAKPEIYRAMAQRFQAMWADAAAFESFHPGPPDAPVALQPANGASNVSTSTNVVWRAMPFAVSYDVYVGTAPGSMAFAGNVPALLVRDPPQVYSFKPSLHGATTYYWRVVARTNATVVDPSLTAASSIQSFTTVPVRLRWVASTAGAPHERGLPLTLSASATAEGNVPLEYKFWLLSARTATWSVLRDYGPSPQVTWTPAEEDTYSLQVWVRRAGSTLGYEDWQPLGPITVARTALRVTGLAPDVASPVPARTPVTWMASAIGAGDLEYQFWLLNVDSGQWSVMQAYSPSSTATWRPSVAGTYSLQVWVRRSDSTAAWEAWRPSEVFRVTAAAVMPVTLAGVKASPQFPVGIGTPVTIDATAYGGSGQLHYKFWLYNPRAGGWSVLQDYAPNPRLTWTPREAGEYSMQVWVRTSTSALAYEAWRPFGPLHVTGQPVTVTGFWPSATNVERGTPVTFAARAQASGAALEYRFWLYDVTVGTWTALQPYRDSSFVQWLPSAPGDYYAQVWVRRAGSGAAYEAWQGSERITVR